MSTLITCSHQLLLDGFHPTTVQGQVAAVDSFTITALAQNEQPIEFKVKVTQPKEVNVRPAKGTLQPGEAVIVTALAPDAGAVVGQAGIRLMIVADSGSGAQQKIKLDCVFPPSLLHSSSSDPSSAAATTTTTQEQHRDPEQEQQQREEMNSTTTTAIAAANAPSSDFTISFFVLHLTSDGVHSKYAYRFKWKRGTTHSGATSVCRTGDAGSVVFNDGSISIQTRAHYKEDGTPVKRLLQLFLEAADMTDADEEDEAAGNSTPPDSAFHTVASVKVDTTEFVEGTREADLPLKFSDGLSRGVLKAKLAMASGHHAVAPAAATSATAAPSDKALPSSLSSSSAAAPPQTPGSASSSASASPLSLSATPTTIGQRTRYTGTIVRTPRLTTLYGGGNAAENNDARAAAAAAAGEGSAFDTNAANVTAATQQPPAAAKSTNVTVCVRLRPILKASETVSCWDITDDKKKIYDDEDRNYDYDHVFSPACTTVDVFEEIKMPVFIEQLFEGINGTVFMYGQTASGKTYTMFGEHEGKEGYDSRQGLIPMLLRGLFDLAEKTQAAATAGNNNNSSSSSTVEVSVGYFEIYNEELNDLLDVNRRNLPIRTGKDGCFHAEIVRQKVSSAGEALSVLTLGSNNKKMGQSILNDRSSRSHSIFQVRVKHTMQQQGGKKKIFNAEMNLVDLAGSETLHETGSAAQKKETSHINLSLTFLKKVITELAHREKHISYRNSSLTKILKHSIGGNSRTAVICCVTPAVEYKRDTKNTLNFGTTAKSVQTMVRANQLLSAADQIAALKQRIAVLEAAVSSYKGMEKSMLALQDENDWLGTAVEELERERERSVQLLQEQQQQQQEREQQGDSTTEDGETTATTVVPASDEGGVAAADASQQRGEASSPTSKTEEVTAAASASEGSRPPGAPKPPPPRHARPTASTGSSVSTVGKIPPPPPPPRRKGSLERAAASHSPASKYADHEVGRLRTQIEEMRSEHGAELALRNQALEEALAKAESLAAAASGERRQQGADDDDDDDDGDDKEQANASKEVLAAKKKDDSIEELLKQVHSFLHFGTALHYLDAKKGSGLLDKVFMHFVKHKGELFLVLCEVDKDERAVRERVISRIPMSECKRLELGQFSEEFVTFNEKEKKAMDRKKKLEDARQAAAAAAVASGNTDDVSKLARSSQERLEDEEETDPLTNRFRLSFTLYFKKKRTVSVTCFVESDFEAWVIGLNRLLPQSAEWKEPLNVKALDQADELSQEEQRFCSTWHIHPSEFLSAKVDLSQNLKDAFVTLFDIRTYTGFDLYHSQQLFKFMHLNGWVSTASLSYMTPKFSAEFADVLDEL